MTLTGPYILLIVVLLTVATLAGAIVAPVRVPGFGPLSIGYRVLVLIVVNPMVLLTATVMLKDKYLFYVD